MRYVINRKADSICSYCREPLDVDEIVVQTCEKGVFHKMHRECYQQLLEEIHMHEEPDTPKTVKEKRESS